MTDEVFPSDCCVCRPCYKKLDDIDKMKNKLLLMESDLKQKLKRIEVQVLIMFIACQLIKLSQCICGSHR